MTKIRALLFDLGNVLIHFSHERMCRQIGTLVGRDGDEVRRATMESGLFGQYERGLLSTLDMHREIERLFCRSLDRDALISAASDIFWRNESIEPLIEQLSDRGYTMVLVSNTCDAHFRWVAGRFPVLRYFPQRTLSFEVGACKPQPKIYCAATELAGVHPAECFFTDDTPGHIEAARQLGIDAVVYRNTPQLVAELKSRGIACNQEP